MCGLERVSSAGGRAALGRPSRALGGPRSHTYIYMYLHGWLRLPSSLPSTNFKITRAFAASNRPSATVRDTLCGPTLRRRRIAPAYALGGPKSS
jgi:hypothetical protein